MGHPLLSRQLAFGLATLAAGALLASTERAFALPPPSFVVDGDSRGGFATLSWSAPGAAKAPEFHVEAASAPSFTQSERLYQGKQTRTVVSGLRDGTVYYRARYRGEAGWSEWSPPERFVVKHPAMRTALLLFGVGALVFFSTVAVVIRGSRGVSD